MKCQDCQWWRGREIALGSSSAPSGFAECRRFPPAPVPTQYDHFGGYLFKGPRWLMTHQDEYCGEYEPQERYAQP